MTATCKNNRGSKNVLCFATQSADTDVINLILTEVPDTDPTNAGQDLLPLMVACLAGKRHTVKWFVIRGQLQPV